MQEQGEVIEVIVEIPYPSERLAKIVCGSLSVDKELRRDLVQRRFSSDGTVARVSFTSTEPKVLRTSVSSFFDMLAVANDAINDFDEQPPPL